MRRGARVLRHKVHFSSIWLKPLSLWVKGWEKR